MLSILNFESSVTHRAVFYATLIAPIAGAICHFCLFGKFCFLPKSRPLLLFVVFAFAFRASKKSRPFGFLRILQFLLLPFAPAKKKSRPSGFLRILPLFRVQQTELVQFQMKACLYNHNIFLKFDCLFYIKLRLIKWRTNFIASECRL